MLSKRIATLRKNMGMSQSQLAAQLNISPSAIGMYEQGRRIPDLLTIIALANIFEVSLDYLITGSESAYVGKLCLVCSHPRDPFVSCCEAKK